MCIRDRFSPGHLATRKTCHLDDRRDVVGQPGGRGGSVDIDSNLGGALAHPWVCIRDGSMQERGRAPSDPMQCRQRRLANTAIGIIEVSLDGRHIATMACDHNGANPVDDFGRRWVRRPRCDRHLTSQNLEHETTRCDKQQRNTRYRNANGDDEQDEQQEGPRRYIPRRFGVSADDGSVFSKWITAHAASFAA